MFRFGSKAETLVELDGSSISATIPAFVFFSVGEWEKNRDRVIDMVQKRFGVAQIAIRSSGVQEDGESHSAAGQFCSVLDVSSGRREEIREATERVIQSFVGTQLENRLENQILYQEYISQVLMSGVAFTRELNTGAPYYIINYDDQTGATDTVTAGGQYSNRTLVICRNAASSVASPRFKSLVLAIQTIEEVTSTDKLDIEFAVDETLTVNIFQVRRITNTKSWKKNFDKDLYKVVSKIKEDVRKGAETISDIAGAATVYGQMPDWNPAEIVGRAPRPLAFSLYRHLITDSVWSAARAEMGYVNIDTAPLVISLGGQPFVDVRLSFNSLLPDTVPFLLRSKLINEWICRLAKMPELHDKVEFEVAISSFIFDLRDRIEQLYPGKFSSGEISVFADALVEHTNKLLSQEQYAISTELASIFELDRTLGEIRKVNAPKWDTEQIRQMCDLTIRQGTLPFAKLARHAFIAMNLLKSLVRVSSLCEQDVACILLSTTTVAGEFKSDCQRVGTSELTEAEFMEKYGHLRPGTYDILSKRYDQRESSVFFTSNDPIVESKPAYLLPNDRLQKIETKLREAELDISAQKLIDYVRDAVTAREYSKFVFTKGVSEVIEYITEWGRMNNFSREQLSFLEIEDILLADESIGVQRAPRDSRRELTKSISTRKKEFQITSALRLPQLICEDRDVEVIPLRVERPNFISDGSISGRCVHISSQNDISTEDGGVEGLDRAIVLIENADPGFDWIFSHNIAGLITKFGGANSHMAIRCAEFGLPAAIGCGEQIFERIYGSDAVELNCAEGHIRTL